MADVLMVDFAEFQVDQHKAFEDAMVEYQVDVIVVVVQTYAVLVPDIGKALAQFQ